MNPQTDKLRIGILGTANVAIKSVIPAILGLPNYFDLIGIASRDEIKAKVVSENFGVHCFSSYSELIDKKIIDAIYIPLPNSLHYAWVKKSLLAGLHVLVEKSMGCDFNEVVELNEIAIAQELVLIENFQFRFHSQLIAIKELIASGSIGELRCMRSSFGFAPFLDLSNIRYNKELGGGALLDAAAYPIKISQILIGEEIEVKASSLNFDVEKGVDIWGGAYLKQKSGSLFSEIAFGFDNYYQCNLELWGSKGKLYTNRIFTAPLGYSPIITLDCNNGTKEICLNADSHFINMLNHFYILTQQGNSYLREDEYRQNKNQARLIEELRIKANE